MLKRPQKAPSKSILDSELTLLLSTGSHILGSPKLDGYRCTTDNGAHTSSMKKITNRYIQEILSDPIYNGLDGELIVGKPNLPETFNNTTGPVRKFTGEPDFKFYVFDRHDMPRASYEERHSALDTELPFVHVVKQKPLYTVQQVIDYELKCVEQDFEGAMIRSLAGRYKQGRCTLRELNIFKRKPVVDGECTIIGFEEQMLNNNKSRKNEMGSMVRSSHKENKTGKGTLGSFVCESTRWPGAVFKIGTGLGLDDKTRQWVWNHREECLGELYNYTFQLYGSINAPRQPIGKGFRDPKDMTDY